MNCITENALGIRAVDVILRISSQLKTLWWFKNTFLAVHESDFEYSRNFATLFRMNEKTGYSDNSLIYYIALNITEIALASILHETLCFPTCKLKPDDKLTRLTLLRK